MVSGSYSEFPLCFLCIGVRHLFERYVHRFLERAVRLYKEIHDYIRRYTSMV